TVAETQWLVYDIVARCTFPAILDALGHHDEARWMRRQPRVTSDATTPLVTHGDHWGLHSFGIDRATRAKVTITDAGQMAADDLFHPFFMQFKKGFCRGGFCFGTDESLEYLRYALSTPDGPERAGIGLARAHDDAVALVVSAFTTLCCPLGGSSPHQRASHCEPAVVKLVKAGTSVLAAGHLN